MKLSISIIGCGYVGSVTGIGLANLGNVVTLVDIDNTKINAINSGKTPVYEIGLNDLLLKNKNYISATSNIIKAIQNTGITFICVGTPSKQDGSINLKYIKSAANDIGIALKNKNSYHIIIVKSTVFPGTVENIILPIIESVSGKNYPQDFGLSFNPEFLKEGTAIVDFMNPDRIIIGVNDEKSKTILENLYNLFNCPKLITNIHTAEMIKYASNAFLATKISFANEIGNLCKLLDIDSSDVFTGVAMDKRINPSFFATGIGFGGSCFPKDIKALITGSESMGLDTKILKAVIDVNENQPLKIVKLLNKHISNLNGVKIGILGLAFKPGTDDIRESRAIPIVDVLVKKGANIVAYDPQAMESFRKKFPLITYAQTTKDALNSDVILILTEWDEFKKLDYSGKFVIDGRRIPKAQKEALIYEGVCW